MYVYAYISITRADAGKAPEENLALAYVFGVDAERTQTGNNGINYYGNNRIRFGTTPNSRRDYSVFTMNPYAFVNKGDTLAVRHYMLTDQFVDIQSRAAQWVSEVRSFTFFVFHFFYFFKQECAKG